MTFDDIIKRNDPDAQIIKEAVLKLSVTSEYSNKTFWEIFDLLVNHPVLEVT